MIELGLITLDKDGSTKIELLEEEDKNISIPFSKFYFHFPWVYYETYGFGTNEGGRLGLKDLTTTSAPKVLSGLGMKKIVGICSGMSHTFVSQL